MKPALWRLLGLVAYWLLLPLICIYTASTKPRARVLLIHDNHALVVKNWLGAGGWALPGGGVEKGEAPADAAIREVQEELGFAIEPGALKPFGEHVAVEKGGLKSKYYLFCVELLKKPELAVKTDEIVDYAWVPLADLVSASEGVGSTVKQSVTAWLEGRNLLS